MEWMSVTEKLPCNAGDKNQQREVVFYANPYEWWTGMFTCKGKFSDRDKFEYHQHWGDDEYHEIRDVKYWIELPDPPKTLNKEK